MSENSNRRVCLENMDEAANGITDRPAITGPPGAAKRAAVDRYSVALGAALLILEDVDTLPTSNVPIRLATVIGHVLDAIYAAESWQRT